VLDTTKGAGIPSCDSGRDLRDSRRECGVDRYAGLNRYQTATAIAKYVDYVAYHKGYDNLNVFLADGDNLQVRGGALTISWAGGAKPVRMTGAAATVFEGRWTPPQA